MKDEEVLNVILDLEKMIRRAHVTLTFHAYPGRHLFPLGMYKVVEFQNFIQECQQMQMDLLRPWERID